MTNQSTSPSKVTAVKAPKIKPVPEHPLMREYLSTDQLAVLLNTPSPVIRESRRTGKLFGRKAPEYVRIGDRKLLYEAVEIIRWIDAGKRGTVVGSEK